MLPVVWLDSADDDLKIIIEFIAERNPIAAAKLRHRLPNHSSGRGNLGGAPL